MSRRPLKLTKRRNGRDRETAEIIPLHKKKFEPERVVAPIKALNPTQALYIKHLRTSPQLIVLGPSGTGKSWIASTHAADLYRNGEISKIYLTRPNVPGGRSLGYFKGTLAEKSAPWVAPIMDAIEDRMGRSAFDIAIKNGDIEIVPFEVMRGRSWKNAFVILDEGQNATFAELKMFLTRIGENCTTVIDGDIGQCDIPATSGLGKILRIVEAKALPVPIVEFSIQDVVRGPECKMWVEAFEAMGV